MVIAPRSAGSAASLPSIVENRALSLTSLTCTKASGASPVCRYEKEEDEQPGGRGDEKEKVERFLKKEAHIFVNISEKGFYVDIENIIQAKWIRELNYILHAGIMEVLE